jgi:hypothetical protein
MGHREGHEQGKGVKTSGFKTRLRFFYSLQILSTFQVLPPFHLLENREYYASHFLIILIQNFQSDVKPDEIQRRETQCKTGLHEDDIQKLHTTAPEQPD